MYLHRSSFPPAFSLQSGVMIISINGPIGVRTIVTHNSRQAFSKIIASFEQLVDRTPRNGFSIL